MCALHADFVTGGASDIVKAESSRDSEVSGYLEASFLIFLTLGSITQSNTPEKGRLGISSRVFMSVRVPEVSSRDRAGCPYNRGPSWPKLSAIHVTAKVICKHLV